MIEIRRVTIQDLKCVVDLFDNYRIFYKKESNKEMAFKFISERIWLDDSKIFVAETENKLLIGFVQLYPIFSSIRMEPLWLLNDLFVDQQYRGKGISKLLIKASKEHCKQTKSCGIILETEKTNVVGNELYPKVGFELDKEHNYYYWDNN